MLSTIKKFISGALTVVALLSPLTASASLSNYYGDIGQKLPSIADRSVIADECGIENYRGTVVQNIALEDCMRNADYWAARIKENGTSPLTSEELSQIPERAWRLVTPQIIQVVTVDKDFLGGSDPIVKKQFTCYGDDCNKYITAREDLIGFSVVSRYKTTLQSSMTSSQTYVPVSSLATFDGHTLTMNDLGSVAYLTIEPGSSREEITKCTGITTRWDPCTRGLAFYGTSEDSVSTNQKAHNAGSIVVMSNVHYVYDQLVDRESNETASGTKKFASNELLLGDGTAATSKYLYLCDSQTTSTCGFIYAAPSSTNPGYQTLGYSRDGTELISFDTGSSGLIASSTRAIGITDGKIHVSASSTGGLEFDRENSGGTGYIQVKASSTTGIVTDTNGLAINKNILATSTPGANQIVMSSTTSQIAGGWLGQTTAGDLIYFNGNTFSRLAIGTPGYILKATSTPASPYWQKPFDAGVTTTPKGVTGTKTFNHTLGATPSMIIFDVVSQTDDNSGGAAPALSWSHGMATSTAAADNNSIACFMQGGTATGKNCVNKAQKAIELYNGGGTAAFSFAVTAWDSTTFTITISTNNSAGINDNRLFTYTIY